MPWEKLGLVHAPSGNEPAWAAGYAAFPTAQCLPDGRLRVYYTTLDARRDGYTAWLELAPEEPTRVLARCDQPLLAPGAMGEFDDCGANVFSAVHWQGRTLLHYQGWQRCEKVPYLIFTGAAELHEGAHGPVARRLQATPVLERTPEQPTLRGAPCVLAESIGTAERLRMWYVSNTAWAMHDGQPRYHVEIRCAYSHDGLAWVDEGVACLQPQGDEYAVGRPAVLRTTAGYHMWFAVRSQSRPYRMGHAHSADGLHWQRDDNPAQLLQASSSGWDSEMVCYPNVIEAAGQRLQFYNGNRHGRSGFGVARWCD